MLNPLPHYLSYACPDLSCGFYFLAWFPVRRAAPLRTQWNTRTASVLTHSYYMVKELKHMHFYTIPRRLHATDATAWNIHATHTHAHKTEHLTVHATPNTRNLKHFTHHPQATPFETRATQATQHTRSILQSIAGMIPFVQNEPLS